MHLASFGLQVSMFISFYCIYNLLKLYTVSMDCLQQRLDFGKTALEKTGPNEAYGVLWATSEYFIFFLLNLLYTKVIYSIYVRFTGLDLPSDGGVGENGHRRLRCVIWASSESFFIFICCIIYLLNFSTVSMDGL